MKNVLSGGILLILGFAIYGTTGLVVHEWQDGNICPKIIGIPACYIVMFCFVGGLVSQLFSNSKFKHSFFIFIGLVFGIALTGTIGELTGLAKCPRTSGGIPMCFISLGICTSLLVLKLLRKGFEK